MIDKYTRKLEALSEILGTYKGNLVTNNSSNNWNINQSNYTTPTSASPFPLQHPPPGVSLEEEVPITNKMILDYLKVQSFLMKEILDTLIELKKSLSISNDEDEDSDIG